MNREDFPFLNQNIIYLDNGATTLKPSVMIDALTDYYANYSANAHRGDYDISLKVDEMYGETRELVKEFIHAKKHKEIVFTSGTTDSLNRIVFGFFKNYLEKDDEILLTNSEHSSNLLPWFELADKIGVKVKYLPLNENFEVTLESLKKSITPRTKVLSIAHVTNVIGDVRPIKELIEEAHKHNILCVIDGAQSVPHLPIDVENLDIDFLAFSAHKMCGPTGLGIMYAKEEYINRMYPIEFGGGMNASFMPSGERLYNESPDLFEAGTQHIAGIIAFGATLKYLKNIGLDKIHNQEKELKKYAVERLHEIPQIKIYNEKSDSGIISFNYDDVFAQDLAIYLNKYNICVRAGSHCAKILNQELGIKNTCRISFYFYNTKEEIDKLIEVLKNPKLKEEII